MPPSTVDPVEGVGTDAVDDAPDLIRGERNEIRIAAHEADEADIRHNGDRVAHEERAAAIRAVRPMERRAAIEVTTALNERDTGQQLACPAPGHDRGIVALDPLTIGERDVDRGST